MFIVIDGIDGSWKWTQLKLVQKALESQGKKVFVLDYPRYWKTSAFAVEKYLNGEYGKNISPKLSSIFYALDRFDDSFNFRDLRESYDYIISNRYVSASMIHQWGKIWDQWEREEFLRWLTDLEYNIFWIPKPDKTLFLNVSPKMSNSLVEKKEKRDYIKWDHNKDIHEADVNHMIDAYMVAHEIVEKNADWIKIDCEKNGKILPKEEITQKILETIKN